MVKNNFVVLSAFTRSILFYNKVLIAFSAGTDSTFLAKTAFDLLGQNAVAVTAVSETYTKDELEFAQKLMAEWGMRHIILETSELEIPQFKNNPVDRCYYCKFELFSKLKKLADEMGIPYVLEGSNADDLKDYRPGRRAIEELGIKSPLLEAGLTKAEIRELSKQMGLPTHDKPALACLASRFPYGEEITKEKLDRVYQAEKYLREKFKEFYPFQLRVRHMNGVAKIEVDKKMIAVFEKELDSISRQLKVLGFSKVELDPKGYRTGSLNEKIKVPSL
ncbi:MAG: ATP-dependent sacrificial sulfur transferase LarE [Candidatus Margulisbacteria bacterium]|nr:ATP-dependent sacrificial sulfur transferase LarE [Candidatus Margulisiibacteriota bacterium]